MAATASLLEWGSKSRAPKKLSCRNMYPQKIRILKSNSSIQSKIFQQNKTSIGPGLKSRMKLKWRGRSSRVRPRGPPRLSGLTKSFHSQWLSQRISGIMLWTLWSKMREEDSRGWMRPSYLTKDTLALCKDIRSMHISLIKIWTSSMKTQEDIRMQEPNPWVKSSTMMQDKRFTGTSLGRSSMKPTNSTMWNSTSTSTVWR